MLSSFVYIRTTHRYYTFIERKVLFLLLPYFLFQITSLPFSIPLLSIFFSYLRSLPSGRSTPPMAACFSMLSFFFKFVVGLSLAHRPVQSFLSWSSPSSFTFHSSFYYFSLIIFSLSYNLFIFQYNRFIRATLIDRHHSQYLRFIVSL